MTGSGEDGTGFIIFAGAMADYTINVTEIEELQTIKDMQSLDTIFSRAKSAVNGGGTTFLVRKKAGGQADRFDEISTLEDLQQYKDWVYKYL
jgi:hypothetical protein